MNVCYCIICHKNTKILSATVNALYRDNDIYLHVDAKSNISDFDKYKKMTHILEKRIDVRWGSYSQIECMMALLSKVSKKDYDYICFLSGDCLPLKNSDRIKEFFIQNNGKEFIGVQKKFDSIQLEKRVKYKYRNGYYKKDKNYFEIILEKIYSKLNPLKENKLYSLLPQLYKGPNWFCITSNFCDYILQYLEKNHWYEKAFKNSLCSDEVFFQTIIMNSKFKNNIYNFSSEEDDNKMALRYIDWESGPEYPKILTEGDFENIKKSNCLFARKFSENLDIESFNKKFSIFQI